MSRRTINDLLDEAAARLDRVDPLELAAEVAAGAVVIDTRAADTRRHDGVIPRSIHVPLSVLPWRLDPASASRDESLADLASRIILVCKDGYSSVLAAATLRDLGFANATDLAGGFTAYAAAGLPVERPADGT
jgi:rhodanese-related sulfurtransferase